MRAARIALFIALAVLGTAFSPIEITAAGARPGEMPVAGRSAADIVDKVEGYRLERIVRALSGADSIFSGADRTKIATRYALSAGIGVARRYLTDEIRSAGYEPSIGRFVLNVAVPDLTGTACSGAGDTVWTADSQGKIYLSAAAGGWPAFVRRGNIGHIIYDLERDPRGRLWAAVRLTGSANGALFMSADGGASWVTRAEGADIYTLGTVAFSSEQFGMAAGSNGTVLRTADFGESWSPLDPATFGYEAFNGIAASGPMRYWLVTDSGYLYETSDFGGTWHSRSLMYPMRLTGIAFHGERAGVAVGSGKAFYTKDAGASWTSVPVATEFTAVCMRDSLKVMAAGTGGEVWISEDGGATWGRFGTECSLARDVWSIASADGGAYWLSGRDLARRVTWSGSFEDCAAYQFADTIWGENISFRREGEREPGRRVLLTAHYDSKSGTPYDCAPGADDNASGVAAVLECARILRGERLSRSVEFVLFDGEELGLVGSRAYAAALDTNAAYDGVLNLDMIGWDPSTTAMTAAIGRRVATADSIVSGAMNAAIEEFDLPLSISYLLPGEPGSSDHISFWDAGVPAALLIEGRSGERTPYYHTCGDAANTLNYDFLEVCAQTALGAISILAGLVHEEPPSFALRQNFPNPFNSGTVLSYSLDAPADVELAVYDVAGRRAALIERSSRGAGEYWRPWDGKDEGGRRLSSGVYFLRLKAGSSEAVRKIVILR